MLPTSGLYLSLVLTHEIVFIFRQVIVVKPTWRLNSLFLEYLWFYFSINKMCMGTVGPFSVLCSLLWTG